MTKSTAQQRRNSSIEPEWPRVLYHVKRTIVDWHHDKSGATQNTKIMGTFAELSVAKAEARICLFEEGYEREWFESFETNISETANANNNREPWKHGDGVILYAKATSGEEFFVSIETVENPKPLASTPMPSSEITCKLFHIIQTNILYNEDRCGARRSVQVEGTYLTREEAEMAARGILLNDEVTEKSFEEYDERREQSDWDFGEDVVVHAVTQTGENILVSVQETLEKSSKIPGPEVTLMH